MSRSRRKTPITGHTTCRSEREDKKIWHQRWRSREASMIFGCSIKTGRVNSGGVKLRLIYTVKTTV